MSTPTPQPQAAMQPARFPCSKRPHRTQAEAETAWGELRSVGGARGDTLHVYWCGRCQAWHLGHARVESRRWR